MFSSWSLTQQSGRIRSLLINRSYGTLATRCVVSQTKPAAAMSLESARRASVTERRIEMTSNVDVI